MGKRKRFRVVDQKIGTIANELMRSLERKDGIAESVLGYVGVAALYPTLTLIHLLLQAVHYIRCHPFDRASGRSG